MDGSVRALEMPSITGELDARRFRANIELKSMSEKWITTKPCSGVTHSRFREYLHEGSQVDEPRRRR